MDIDSENTTLSTIPKLVAQVLKIYEVEPKEVFEEAQIDYEDAISNSNRISMEKMFDLWKKSVEVTQNQEIGLVCASLFQPTYIKGLGLAWMASKNLVEGLELFVANGKMVNTALNIELVKSSGKIMIKYGVPSTTPQIKPHPCALQLGVGFFLKMFRVAAGKSIPASEVYFAMETPINQTAYDDFFECPVNFESEFNAISFSESLLMELLPTRDEELVEMNKLAVEKYVSTLGQPETAEKVTNVVSSLLATGCPSEEEVAYKLHMSKRTLQRKLKAEGKGFSQLLNSIRFSLAKEYLVASTNSITDIAYSLGYSSPSTFARAFKQFSGETPVEFRKTH